MPDTKVSGLTAITAVDDADIVCVVDTSDTTMGAGGSTRKSTKANFLKVGTDIQAYDADLAALAGLTSAADKGIQFSGSGTAATFDLTTAGKALIDDASASAQRTTLGVAIGSDVQAHDAELDTLAALTEARGSVIIGNSTPAWSALAVGSARQILQSDATDTAWANHPVEIGMACSDETTVFTASTSVAKATFRMPHAMTLTEVRASVTTAASGGGLEIDVHDSGTTIFSTKVTIDDIESTSTTASTPAVISDSALADDAEIEIFIDSLDGGNAATGLKVFLIGYR
jgi:hypothetical protein